MSLKEYKKKRDLHTSCVPRKIFKKKIFTKGKKSGEPKAIIKKNSKKLYVIQEHHASHLHWDLRLEMNGVLKSWALPKQPPKSKHLKRLAIQVEDHPLGYADFEGEIKEGYGKGKVEIWDKGTYQLIEKDKDKFEFELHGKILKGTYVLVNAKLGGEKKNWLFMKVN